jgi:chemotaxis protein histidine kinase CheA
MPQPKTSATSAATKRRTTAAKPKAASASKPAARKPASAAKASTAAKAAGTGKASAAKPRTATAAKKASAAKPTSAAARKPAAAKAAAPKAAAAKPAAAKKPVATAAKPKATSTRASAAKASAPKAPPRPTAAAKPRAKRDGEPVAQIVSALQEQLTEASSLVGQLIGRGRKPEAAGNLEELLGKGLEQLEQLSRKLEGGATKARRADSVDRLMRSADRARRAVGVGPSFPILAYDELSVRQITERLGDLKPAELRKVRDYERRHANRKGILTALEKALA